MTDQPASSGIAARYKAEAVSLAIMLILLAAAWWFLKLHPYLVGGLAACLLLGPAWPPRFAWLGTLLGMLGLAALAYFHFGNQQIAIVFAVLGVVLAGARYKNIAL